MSNISQKVRPGTKGQQTVNSIQAGNWNKMFPSKLETWNKSCMFVKRLVTLAVSNITYLRSIFPEEAYCNRSLDGVKLKILLEDNKFKPAATLAGWLVGAFEALEMKYLRELAIVIHLDQSDPNTVHELYTFKFNYSDGKVACAMVEGQGGENSKASPDSIYNSTRELLQSILISTQSLRSLPTNICLSVKLKYFDDVTPNDYEPRGFVPAEYHDMAFPDGSFPVELGSVATKYHGVQLSVNAIQDGKESSSFVNNNYLHSATESDSGSAQPIVAQNIVAQESSILCSCESFTHDKLMLKCDYCFKLQHGACYRIVSSNKIPKLHCCLLCHLDTPLEKTCTDRKLVKMSSKPSLALTCIFRRVLAMLMHSDILESRCFVEAMGVDEDTNRGIFEKLVSENVVIVEKDAYMVNKEVLVKFALPKYMAIKESSPQGNDMMVDKADAKSFDGAVSSVVKRKAESTKVKNKKRKVSDTEVTLKI